ncbi:hypothetical protein CLU81_1275 [Flavobacterium sp. 9]|uniref:hypothetical protein n=1 Tax=Flavobacterium sp. 9 TaxID=2035198 RepID=UPI000C1909A7|nr:hypothetical protein [Flavobacterium sp. 9]PIF30824.1 hypothetical protein CLU81_1275 [Flavobacterium sp. 9]
MKKLYFLIVILLLSIPIFAQNNSKITFQKNRYELAVSYFKKADFKKAIDLYYIAARVIPENEIGIASLKKVDSLRVILRERLLDQALGTWKKVGNKPGWAVDQASINAGKTSDKLVEINKTQILYFEKNKKTQEKKLIKTEDLVYYNGENSEDASFSNVILSDGNIWHCSINDSSNEMHVINVAKKDENGTEEIKSDNQERFYIKVDE